jgi:hypothetical protein
VVEDAIADKNGPMISPAQFKEFSSYNRKLGSAHQKGLKVVRHWTGTSDALDILLDRIRWANP